MRKCNIMHVAVNGNIKWWYMEEIRFQFGYSLTISNCRMFKTPSYLFDTAIQWYILRFGHLSLRGIFATSEYKEAP